MYVLLCNGKMFPFKWWLMCLHLNHYVTLFNTTVSAFPALLHCSASHNNMPVSDLPALHHCSRSHNNTTVSDLQVLHHCSASHNNMPISDLPVLHLVRSHASAFFNPLPIPHRWGTYQNRRTGFSMLNLPLF